MSSTLKRLDDILAHYGLEETRKSWDEGWEASYDAYPDASLPFLEVAYLREQCRTLRMSTEMEAGILEGRTLFDREPALKHLLWYCYDTAFRRVDPLDAAVFRKWTSIPEAIDPAAPLFYVYVFLAGMPHILKHHQALRIPHEITVDTLNDLQVWIKDYRTHHHQWGVAFNQVSWIGLSFAGGMYQIGRLQFEHNRCYYKFHAFRHASDGHVVLLAGDGMQFRQDGQFYDADGSTDSDAWTATLNITNDTISGHMIHPQGYAVKEPVEWSADEWDHILRPDDSTVSVHIPALGPMDFDQCGDAFAQAIPFWHEYFPNHHIHAFMCTSWLLDPQFEQALGPDSNITRFLREWYLLPLPGTRGGETLRRAFGIREADDETLAVLPQDTSLRRAIIHHLQQGKCWRGHGALIFPDHMNWGEQLYRRPFL